MQPIKIGKTSPGTNSTSPNPVHQLTTLNSGQSNLRGERLTRELKNYAPVAAQCDIRVLKSKDQISALGLDKP